MFNLLSPKLAIAFARDFLWTKHIYDYTMTLKSPTSVSKQGDCLVCDKIITDRCFFPKSRSYLADF